MVIDIKPLLRVGLAAQSAALAVENIKLLRKQKNKDNSKRLIKTGVTNIVGISLIRAQGGLIEGL